MMLQVPATFQINRVEQYSEFYKESLKMCSEHNEAKLICCFLSGNKYCTRKKKKMGQKNTAVLSKLVSPCTAADLRHQCFHIKRRRKCRSSISAAASQHLRMKSPNSSFKCPAQSHINSESEVQP